MAEILVAISEIQDKVQDMSDSVSKLVRGQHNKKHQAILDWLTPFDYAL